MKNPIESVLPILIHPFMVSIDVTCGLSTPQFTFLMTAAHAVQPDLYSSHKMKSQRENN